VRSLALFEAVPVANVAAQGALIAAQAALGYSQRSGDAAGVRNLN